LNIKKIYPGVNHVIYKNDKNEFFSSGDDTYSFDEILPIKKEKDLIKKISTEFIEKENDKIFKIGMLLHSTLFLTSF
jgi:hypothetical protein